MGHEALKLTFPVCLRGGVGHGRSFARPLTRHRWRSLVVIRPDGTVVILAYRREADQLRTGVGAASLEEAHPAETSEGHVPSHEGCYDPLGRTSGHLLTSSVLPYRPAVYQYIW
jgi:hypothetical protein